MTSVEYSLLYVKHPVFIMMATFEQSPGCVIILALLCSVVHCQITNGSDVISGNEGMIIAGLVLSLIASIGVVILTIVFICYFTLIKQKSTANSDKTSSRINHEILMEKASHLSALRIEGTDLTTIPLETSNICVAAGTLRQIVLGLFEEIVLNLDNVRQKISHSNRTDLLSEPAKPLPPNSSEHDSIHARIQKRLQVVFGGDTSEVDVFSSIAENILSSTSVRDLLDATFRVCRVAKGVVKEWKVEDDTIVGTVPEDGAGNISFTVEDSVNKVKVTWDDQKFSPEFLDTISLMLQALRDERRQPTPTEYLAKHLAYNYISNGKQLTLKPLRPLGSPGFRPNSQTYISLADSGDGHVLGTTRFNDWMTGTIVHVEHLEGPGSLSVESFRFPSLSDLARVRLHVGSSSPTTYFLGTRMRNTRHFSDEFTTLTNMTSAAASAAFYQGTAECVVAMDGLTTSQAVTFMKELLKQVHRDPFSQALSASWKINESVFDNFDVDAERTLTDKMDIACRALEITCVGGFDKIIWDGVNDSEQVKSIFKQLSIEDAIFLVHEARSRGLLTQFTGNVKISDIKIGVFTGVDSIGVGGPQIIRLPSSEPNKCGAYREEAISSIIKERNEAADSLEGRGAHLLARLDTMYFEGSISSTENGMRCQLYHSMINHDLTVVKGIVEKMDYIMQIQSEYGLPLLGEARRLVDSKSPLLKEVAGSFYEWVLFITRLKTLLDKNDIKGVMEDFDGEPWSTYRQKHRDSTRSRDQGTSGIDTTQL